jgi:phosphatidylserine/phosphatidylglycerophosphate/cardiolipin synthase-like enzyme
LLKLIRHAREKITCVALSFYDTDKVDSIHTELLGALSRGVKVTVIVRPEHFRPDQYPDPSTKRLLENGLRLLGMSALHAKGMVVDGSSCAIFSGNINPYSLQSDANSAQVEIGLFEFGQLSVLRSYGKWLTSLEESADYEYG